MIVLPHGITAHSSLPIVKKYLTVGSQRRAIFECVLNEEYVKPIAPIKKGLTYIASRGSRMTMSKGCNHTQYNPDLLSNYRVQSSDQAFPGPVCDECSDTSFCGPKKYSL